MTLQRLPKPSKVFFKRVRIPKSQLRDSGTIVNGKFVPSDTKKAQYQYLVYSKFPVGFKDADFGTFRANTANLETNARTKKEAIQMKKWVENKYKAGVFRNITPGGKK